MNDTDCEFRLQKQFGQLMDRGSYLIFQAQVTKPESVVRKKEWKFRQIGTKKMYWFCFCSIVVDVFSRLLRGQRIRKRSSRTCWILLHPPE